MQDLVDCPSRRRTQYGRGTVRTQYIVRDNDNVIVDTRQSTSCRAQYVNNGVVRALRVTPY